MQENKTAIVTGAGSGVGRATAELLAQSGYNVVLAGRTRSKLDQTAQRIEQQTADGAVTCRAVTIDITDARACQELVNETVQVYGRIDAMANVAGVAPLMPLEQVTAQVLQTSLDTNLSSVVYLTVAAWPTFKTQNSGVIVNVSTIGTIDPWPGFAAYVSAKAGLNMFTYCTAQEGAAIGLKAVVVAPGAIETPMLRANFDEKMLPRDKALAPRQVGQVVCDCITGKRTFEPGQVIQVPSP